MLTTGRATTLGIALILAALTWPTAAQTPVRWPITLATPVNDFTTFNVVSRLLADSGVLYGLEGPGTDAARSSIDFARAPSQSITIQAQTVDDALKQIAAINTRMRWSRHGELIVVRFGPEQDGFLDQRISRLVVNNASPRGALEALLAALDPGRAPGFGVQGAGRPPAGREGETGARTGAPITLSLTDTTVLDALNTIAKANGAMAWTVNYDAGRARYETANIQFIESGYRVTAMSKVSLAPPIPGGAPDARATVTVPVTGDLRSMLQSYTMQAGLRMGMERLSDQVDAPRTATVTGVPPITLPAVPNDDAIARIVGFDSRYEWSKRNGFYRVRPRAGTTARLDILDRPQSEFVAAGDALEYVLDRVTSMLSGQPMFPSGAGLSLGGPGSSRMGLSRIAPVTFTVPAGGTIADLLDALCLAEGTLSWQITQTPANPTMPPQVQLTISSPLGWSFSRSVRLSAEAAPMRPSTPRQSLPPALDRSIGRLPVSFSPVPGTAFLALGSFARVPLGLEIYPALTPDDDPRAIRRPVAPVVVGPGSFSDALHVLLERLPEYALDGNAPLLTIAPQKLLESKTHFMNVSIDRFEVRDTSIFRAVSLLRQKLDPSFPVSDWPPPDAGPFGGGIVQEMVERSRKLYDKRVTLSVTNATPREILNRLLAAHGELGWAVSYELRTPSMNAPVRVEEGTCVIRLVPAAGTGFIAELLPNTPAPKPTPPVLAVSPPPPMPTGSSRVTVNLPLSGLALLTTVNRLALVLNAPTGAEILATPATNRVVTGGAINPGGVLINPNFSPAVQAYDLTGLPMRDALDKLVQWIPEYAWTLDNGVYHIRPRGSNPASDAMDLKVDRFSGTFSDVYRALAAVRDLVDAQLPKKAAPVAASTPPNPPTNPTPDMQKSLVFDLSNVTIRQILDAMITQHGRLSWTADARHMGGGVNGLQLRVQSVDGFTIMAPLIVR